MSEIPSQDRSLPSASRAAFRPHDWACVALILAVAAIVGAVRGRLLWAAAWTIIVIGAGVMARLWSRKYPGPMPHVVWWTLLLPRGPSSPRHLKAILQSRSGERVLEVGPGIGVHALPIASSLLPGGRLDALDVQQEMLDDLQRRAERAGISNLVPQRGDAQHLPYPDDTFDAASLVGVLGEIPDEAGALRELRRVLKTNGRLVIGEFIVDPDFVSFASLERKLREAGFVFERRSGPRFAYLARFRPVSVGMAPAPERCCRTP